MREIVLDKFKPRDYQRPFFEAMESGKYRNCIFVGARRLGKDLMAWNYAIRHAFSKTTMVLYMLPTYSQCRSVIWDGITNDGTRFLDYIPASEIKSMNGSELKIVLKNNSIIQLRGSDSYDRSIVGSNASLIIFSEAALCDERAFEYASPITAANGGQIILLSTPRGRNFFYKLWKQSEQWPDWFRYQLTVNDTKHVSNEQLEKERLKYSEEYVQQEFFCSFQRGQEGSYYARYVTAMQDDGRISSILYDPSLPVSTAWDLGFNDQTVILFYQLNKSGHIRIIDCYANTNEPLSHYIKVLKDKPYIYQKHFAPHDIAVHDYQTGQTRIEMARELGLSFETSEYQGKLVSATPRLSVADGIERVMASFSRMYIDQKACSRLIVALESYRREWDDENKVYKQKPLHDQHSDFCDSLRILCLTVDMNRTGMQTEDVQRLYNTAVYGTNDPTANIYSNPLNSIPNDYRLF